MCSKGNREIETPKIGPQIFGGIPETEVKEVKGEREDDVGVTGRKSRGIERREKGQGVGKGDGPTIREVDLGGRVRGTMDPKEDKWKV